MSGIRTGIMSHLPDGSRNPDWLAARCGRVTASAIWRIMAQKKDGSPTAEWRSYLVELLTELLTGDAEDRYVTAAMQRGIDMEPAAIAAYEDATGRIVEPCGWVDAGSYGATPDGLVMGGGLVECKCPQSTTVTRLRHFDRAIPIEWRWQMIAQIDATGEPWCDLVIFDDRFRRTAYRIAIVRLTAEEVAADIEAMHARIAEFVTEMDSYLIAPAWGADSRGGGESAEKHV